MYQLLEETLKIFVMNGMPRNRETVSLNYNILLLTLFLLSSLFSLPFIFFLCLWKLQNVGFVIMDSRLESYTIREKFQSMALFMVLPRNIFLLEHFSCIDSYNSCPTSSWRKECGKNGKFVSQQNSHPQ